MKRNAGFTLIEILIVVAIIGVMLAVAVVSVASGRDATRARAAARGVAQMSHYANALALLRQKSAVISFSGNKISVQLSGQGVDTSEIGELADPIYRGDVNGTAVVTPSPEEEENEEPTAEGDAKQEKKGGYMDAGITPDLDDFSKEDAERTFEGILFRVELVDENGQALDATTASQLRSEADAMVNKKSGTAGAAWSNTSGEIDLGATDEDSEKPEIRPENEGRVIYESNGNCAPYRVIIFAATEDGQEGEELMTVNVSRSGKVTIGDEEEKNR